MKPPAIWKDAAFRGAAYGTGSTLLAAGIIAGVKYLFSSDEEEEDEVDEEAEEFSEEMVDVYLDKGPTGLAKWLLKHDEDIETKREASKFVDEFEEENPRVVRKYDRSQSRAESAEA